MATKTDGGEKTFTLDELKLVAPDLFEEFLNRKAQSEIMGEQIEAVSGAIHNAADALAKYRDAYAELQAELAILKDKGGSVTMVPEYREYRKANGQDLKGKGKPSNMEAVVMHFIPVAKDDATA